MPTVQDVTSNTKIASSPAEAEDLAATPCSSLAKRGVHAIFTYNSNRAEAEKVVGLVGKTGQKAVALEFDAENVGTFDNFVEKVRQAHSAFGAVRFDYLVNNAGISHHNSIEKTTEAELDALYNVHFQGRVLPDAEAAAAHQRRWTDHQSVVRSHTHHNAWQRPLWFDEGAIEVLTKYMAKELGSRRIAVQRRRTRRYRHRFQWRHGAGQSRCEQACRRHDRARARRLARRHRTNDRFVAVRGQSLG